MKALYNIKINARVDGLSSPVYAALFDAQGRYIDLRRQFREPLNRVRHHRLRLTIYTIHSHLWIAIVRVVVAHSEMRSAQFFQSHWPFERLLFHPPPGSAAIVCRTAVCDCRSHHTGKCSPKPLQYLVVLRIREIFKPEQTPRKFLFWKELPFLAGSQ